MVAHFNLSQADEWADKGAIARDGALFRAIRDLEAEVLPAVDGLVFVSAFMQRAILERLPAVARVPMAVVPNFVADPGTSPRAEKARDLITAGTLEYRKNQRYALEIVRAARQLGTELTLTVVGDGPDRPMLEKLVRELGIAKQVRFAGFVPDAAGLMPAHRACLHVARMENFPIVLIESMCRGLPVFAPAAGGIPEMFDDGQQGRQIPLDDAEAAARLIVDWMNDAPTLARAGDAARRCYLERFEADRSASRLAAFLDQAGSA
jgi:glycosyltransferase involved in cell wall biosynthesis